ncbi:MAG: Succinylglutamate desuccinylase/aspartoacylase [Candidatus Moranbacteria bacterium GW2011_GWC2_37_8]|nr:MAG: Succinylglutamate desuccinylase/aspartoacylase [Candidatus Moranbacteria bacterium GW2011_GWC2_37_8]KKQ62258.1 MAG: Succinylglutamate desuccinylase/aspartoacylase [Parcubacteria group bacterium GW2011_GWC1_38_22]KKQ81012.1 MAG: Succinylglutamate desuccinylase/aspartoacylase [Candidatus Moranbacteria bacterium GW2011_GWD2_38_7]
MDYKINLFEGNKKPVVAVVGCLHGDELVGKKIISRLRKMKLRKGTLITIVANEKAIKYGKRFIDQDLNRSFPGKKMGNYEEMLAYELLKIAKKADFVLDIHSTTTDVKDLAIITRKGKAVLNLAHTIDPKRIVLMKKSIAKGSFTNHCKVAVSLEYGKDNDKSTFNNTFDSIVSLLEKEKMINVEDKKEKQNKVDFYKITGVVRKSEKDVLKNNIKNFKLIKKGEIFATRNNEEIASKEDFYPVLFGNKSYDDIFGFKAASK